MLKIYCQPGKNLSEVKETGGMFRAKTKRRMLNKISRRYNELQNNIISEESFKQSLQSYLGMLKHCNGFKIKKRLCGLPLDCRGFARSRVAMTRSRPQ